MISCKIQPGSVKGYSHPVLHILVSSQVRPTWRPEPAHPLALFKYIHTRIETRVYVFFNTQDMDRRPFHQIVLLERHAKMALKPNSEFKPMAKMALFLRLHDERDWWPKTYSLQVCAFNGPYLESPCAIRACTWLDLVRACDTLFVYLFLITGTATRPG